jgi:hypothetical protein
MRRSLIVLITLLCALGLMACQSGVNTPAEPTLVVEGSPVNTPVPDSGDGVAFPVEPSSETGVLRGRIISALTTEPLGTTVVIFAEVTRQNGEAVMVLNTATSPTTISDVDGYFILTSVPPGEYVMVVGDPYEVHDIIEDPATQMARFYFSEAGKVTEIGEISVDIGK